MIAGLLAAAATGLALQMSSPPHAVGLILAALCAVLAVGIELRLAMIRKVLVAILWLLIVAEVATVVIQLGAMLKVYAISGSPAEEILFSLIRIFLVANVLSYLRRADVRATFACASG